MNERKPTYHEARAAANAEWLKFVERRILPALTWGAMMRLKMMQVANRKAQRGKQGG